MTPIRTVIALISLVFLAACGAPPQVSGANQNQQIIELTRAISDLGPDVDPVEAARAAEIAYRYTDQLAREYEIVDPPLIHNIKVNTGLKPRGLCWHWAEDMQNRLNAEGFQTLEVHRAIANADSAILIDHSTALISARGDDMYEALVLDPWRFGGVLYWGPTLEDDRYEWFPQAEVLAKRRARLEAKGRRFVPGT